MDSVPAPIPPTPAANMFASGIDDDEIPLGWECANPALQIECWGADEAGVAGFVSES